jgi:hypothetical protein
MKQDQSMTDTEEDRATEDWTDAEYESPFAWELRVMAVSAVWVVPGALFGVLARLCVPDSGQASWWLIGGGVLGAIAGGLLEADYWN